MNFRKPDVKGLRFKTGHVNVLKKDLFKKFIEKYPNYSGIDYELFSSVIKKDNKKIPKIIIENRDGIELRENLGNIFIGSCETGKKTLVNYAESIRLGILVTHKNWDSDNRLAKIVYTNCKSKYVFENRNLWKFKGVREFTREVSGVFKKDYLKYILIDRRMKISSLIK